MQAEINNFTCTFISAQIETFFIANFVIIT
jgi:hypothetical protein